MTIRVRGLDRIPIWTTGWRKWITFRYVSQNQRGGPASHEEFLARWTAIQSVGARTKDLRDMTRGFWKMESLGAAFGRRPPAGQTLNDPRLPVEIRPIAHNGMGVGAVEACGFHPEKIIGTIERLSHPDYRWFAYESIGAMLGAYEVPFPKALIGLQPHRRPEPGGFVRVFSPEIQRLISSGYGRITYFNSVNLSAALRKIASQPFLQVPTAVQGIAFAYAMVNYIDFWLVLETGDGFEDPELGAAFRNGLIYALKYWEWETPGFLRSLKPRSTRSADLIAAAQREIDASLARGYLGAFVVENPAATLKT
jgi:hypothetical protein